jgi:hypothetical protein
MGPGMEHLVHTQYSLAMEKKDLAIFAKDFGNPAL